MTSVSSISPISLPSSRVTDSNLESKEHIIQAALKIAFADDLSEDKVQSKVESLVDRAQDSSLDIDEQEVWDVVCDE